MDINSVMTNGPIARAQRITIFGPHGIGKSTLAAHFPEAIFIDTEDGTSHLVVNRILVNDYKSLCDALIALRDFDSPYRTVVVDTIDHVELFLKDEVCRTHHLSGMEALAYGKAWVFLAEKFGDFVSRYLDPLISAGIHVVVVGHSSVKRIQYPGLDSFDRWELRLYLQCANRLKEWSDALLFLNWEMRIVEGEGKPKGMGGKERIIYTEHSAAHDAKVRIDLGEKLPYTFAAIEPLLCGWQRPAKLSIQQQFANALADIESKRVIAFLIDRKQIRDDQQITDVSADYAREALGRIIEFKQAILEFDGIPF